MLSIIKRFFQKREKLSFEDIDDWLIEQINEREEKKSTILKEFNEEIKAKLETFPEHIQSLKEAKYDKPVEPKVMNSIHQNREIFITKLDKLIQSNSEEIKTKLQQFMENTEKLVYTIKHLYFDQMSNILEDLKSIADMVKFLDSKIERLDLDKYNDLRDEIKNYYSDIKKKEELGLAITENSEKLKELKSKFERLKEGLKKHKSSNSAKGYNELMLNKEELSNKLSSLELTFNTEFSVLETALRKYSKLALNQVIILDYLRSPIKTLVNDKDLKIVAILGNVASKVDRLNLKDKKKEKTLESIEYFNRDKFYKFITDYETLKNKFMAVLDDLKRNTFINEQELIEQSITNLEKKIYTLDQDLVDMRDKEKNLKPDNSDIIDVVEDISLLEIC